VFRDGRRAVGDGIVLTGRPPAAGRRTVGGGIVLTVAAAAGWVPPIENRFNEVSTGLSS
jgi:hypothetical protein